MTAPEIKKINGRARPTVVKVHGQPSKAVVYADPEMQKIAERDEVARKAREQK